MELGARSIENITQLDSYNTQGGACREPQEQGPAKSTYLPRSCNRDKMANGGEIYKGRLMVRFERFNGYIYF